MSDQLIQRAALLLQQYKYNEAETILNSLFAEDPTNTDVIGLMCEVKIYQDKFDEALELVNNAIGLDPGADHLFYKRARIFIHQDRYDDAERDLQEAISLDPYDANYLALLALLKIDRKQYSEALELTDKALKLEADNIQAMNARSTALLKLNRQEESFNVIKGALREEPDNAYTHSNYGWGLLEKGSHQEALHHFSEALRKDPNLELAQSGMAEALKARYLIYRWFMKFSFWMGNLREKYQWFIIIGFLIAYRVLRGIARSNPSFQPFLYPLLVLIALFAFSTWIITPLSNLFLRLNKYGRHLLSREQVISANFVGISALVMISGCILYLFTRHPSWIVLAVFGLTMMVPLSVMFSSKNKKWLLAYTCVLALLGIAGIIFVMAGNDILNGFLISYVVGFILFQWVANFLIMREGKR